KSCISAPLVANDSLIGALSLYSTELNGFNDDHRRIIEVTATQAALTIQRALASTQRRDPLSYLPHLDQLETLLKAFENDDKHVDINSFVVISATRFTAQSDAQDSDEVMRHVVALARDGLRSQDVLFRTNGGDLVAFLPSTDRDTAQKIA